MFGIGWVELVVIAFVGLVAIGPKQLPHVAQTVGETVGQGLRWWRQIKDEIRLDKK